MHQLSFYLLFFLFPYCAIVIFLSFFKQNFESMQNPRTELIYFVGIFCSLFVDKITVTQSLKYQPNIILVSVHTFFKKPCYVQYFFKQEIASDPKFFDEGASADDFAQGSLGNCWFVAACACIAEDKSLLKKVRRE